MIRSYLQPLDHAVPMIATEDVGRTAASLLQEDWTGHRVVELQAERVTPNAIGSAFAKTLGRPVRAEAVPRARWEEIFRSEGMRNPLPRMQMIDGFNEGWIDFPNGGAGARTGQIDIESAIAALVRKRRTDDPALQDARPGSGVHVRHRHRLPRNRGLEPSRFLSA